MNPDDIKLFPTGLDEDVNMEPVPETFKVSFRFRAASGIRESEIYDLTKREISLSEVILIGDPTEKRIVLDGKNMFHASDQMFVAVGHIVKYLKIRDGEPFPYLPKPLTAPKGGRKIDILKSIDDPRVKSWIEDIMNEDKNHFIIIAKMADWLDINCLLHLASATIASLLSGVDRSNYNTVFRDVSSSRGSGSGPVLGDRKRARFFDFESNAPQSSRPSSLVPIAPMGTAFRTRSSSPSSLVPIAPMGTAFHTRSSPPSSPVSNLTRQIPDAPKKKNRRS
jgi:hypothetical protein